MELHRLVPRAITGFSNLITVTGDLAYVGMPVSALRTRATG